MERRTMTVKEVAEYLGVHTDSIYYLVKEKAIPHYKVRSKSMFLQESIEKWIREQENTSK